MKNKHGNTHLKTTFIIITFLIMITLQVTAVYAGVGANTVANAGGAAANVVASVEASAYVNGKQIVLRILTDADGGLYFALRDFMDRLGYSVSWDPLDSSVYLTNGDNSIGVAVGRAKCIKNDATIVMDKPIYSEYGVTYFHQSFLPKILDLNIVRIENVKGGRIDKVYIESDVNAYWDGLVKPNHGEDEEFYWRTIDGETIAEVDYFIAQYGADALFEGLKTSNIYSQYYCINRLVEFYNDGEIRARAIKEITPFLASRNETVKDGAEFALSVLNEKFDGPYILNVAGGARVFALCNNYSDYGSLNELWIIKRGKLTKLCSFSGISHYIDRFEPIRLSPDNRKIAVQTCSRRSTSINVVYLRDGKIGPELMLMALNKIAADNPDYANTYSEATAYFGGEYSYGGDIRWLDGNTLEFEAHLAYNFGDIVEHVKVKYNVRENTMEYTKI